MMKPRILHGRSCSLTLAALVALWFLVPAAGRPHAQHQEGAHQHPDAAKVENPVAADAASIEAGQALFVEHCAQCHGETGLGDGPMAGYIQPLPSNLADGDWKHGTSDGEIFKVIRDGVDETGMESFAEILDETQMWNLVNYIRSLAPKPAPVH